MTSPNTRRLLAQELATAAAAYQTAEIIPHCPGCSQPCCKLETLVLDLEWKQIKTLWQVRESRPVFDKALSSGKGPEEIRESGGRYYVHGKPCPAYDEPRGACRIYGQHLKPVGCTDFPVYEDRGDLIADLRCEAVDLKALKTWITRSLGPAARITQSADDEFPFLVTLSVRKPRSTRN